jgi:hypothetical protein
MNKLERFVHNKFVIAGLINACMLGQELTRREVNLWDILRNISLAWKKQSATNTLAYLFPMSVKNIKKFHEIDSSRRFWRPDIQDNDTQHNGHTAWQRSA